MRSLASIALAAGAATVYAQESSTPATYKATFPGKNYKDVTGIPITGFVSATGIQGPDFDTPEQPQGWLGADFTVNIPAGLTEEHGPYTYHIHEKPVPSDGDCAATGAHFDPSKVGTSTPCDPNAGAKCQWGDLSGKHGKISMYPFEVQYRDMFLSTNASSPAFFGNLSVVVHANDDTRITCANFVLVDAEGGSGSTPGYGSPPGYGQQPPAYGSTDAVSTSPAEETTSPVSSSPAEETSAPPAYGDTSVPSSPADETSAPPAYGDTSVSPTSSSVSSVPAEEVTSSAATTSCDTTSSFATLPASYTNSSTSAPPSGGTFASEYMPTNCSTDTAPATDVPSAPAVTSGADSAPGDSTLDLTSTTTLILDSTSISTIVPTDGAATTAAASTAPMVYSPTDTSAPAYSVMPYTGSASTLSTGGIAIVLALLAAIV